MWLGAIIIGVLTLILPGGSDPTLSNGVSLALIIGGAIWGLIEKEYKKTEFYKVRELIKEAKRIEEYKAAAESQQNGTPWQVRYSTSPCPHCGHYKVRCAKWEDKQMSVAFWGMASDKIGKQYKCENCKRMW